MCKYVRLTFAYVRIIELQQRVSVESFFAEFALSPFCVVCAIIADSSTDVSHRSVHIRIEYARGRMVVAIAL